MIPIQPQLSSGRLERFSYDDAIVRKFTLAMGIWGLVAFAVGLLAAVELLLPPLRDRMGEGTVGYGVVDTLLSIPYLQFGRLRPLHTNAAIFAFAGNAVFAAVYYSTQRLCKARMWSDKLSALHFWGWQLIIVLAALTLPLGITQGKEYAELEWPIDLLIAVVWLFFFGTNFFMTLAKRRERHMYVALWFYIATIVAVTVLHVFNNLVVPVFGATLVKSYPIYAGVQDAFMQWWYGHNAVAFFLTTPFLGLMYYFLPKAAERPVFSYRLSIIHFWSIVFIYIWAGPHHLHYTAIPEWCQALGMAFSVMLWMPSWGGMLNGLLTLRGAWHKVASEPVLKFFVVGITFYGMATFEGPMMSIKSVNAMTHYTDYTIAHVHGGALGWNGMMAFGMMYWLLPRLFQTGRLYSKKLAATHFWLATAGILLYILPIYVAGLMQGSMWRQLDAGGQIVHPFMKVMTAMQPMYALRAVGGTVFILGALVGAWNFFKTWQMRPAAYEVPVYEAPALTKEYDGDDAAPEANHLGPVIDAAKDISIFSTMWWHRRWERFPVMFTWLVLAGVLIATAFELVPMFLIRSNVPTIASVKPYTPLELYGRDLYISEGCYNCHSQMIRPMLAEVKRYGEYSKPGEFVYDHPFQWGSRRIGPDLAREGGRQSNAWHLIHLRNPTQLSTGSIMPPYRHLLEGKIDYDSIPLRVKAMQHLGVPYTDADYAKAKESAKAQAAQMLKNFMDSNGNKPLDMLSHDGASVIGTYDLTDTQSLALVAYLQRMGTDLSKTAPAAPATPAASAATPPAQGSH